MGAWGEGPFANDDAADFLGDLNDLSEGELTATLREKCRGVLGGGYLEIPAVCEAVAAAALLAVHAGAPAPIELNAEDTMVASFFNSPAVLSPIFDSWPGTP